MDLPLKEDDQAFVDALVAQGRYGSAAEVVEDGLRALRQREAKLAALRDTLERSIAQGGSNTSEEVIASVDQLLDSLEREPAHRA
jgi:antitoxin ParD1/3/4